MFSVSVRRTTVNNNKYKVKDTKAKMSTNANFLLARCVLHLLVLNFWSAAAVSMILIINFNFNVNPVAVSGVGMTPFQRNHARHHQRFLTQ